MSAVLGALAAGILFGLGLAVSQMADPAKVLGFLDIAGRWDPSLALVMASALAVTAAGYRLVLRRPAPVFGKEFGLPAARAIDMRLIAGAAVFGIGWGLAGFCPGPAIAALAWLQPESLIFLAAMATGMWIARKAFP